MHALGVCKMFVGVRVCSFTPRLQSFARKKTAPDSKKVVA